jgi:predicted RNA-binding Zn-ribbon protein involved in translation (DUF1610 family)
MPIAFACKSCGITVQAPDGAAGRTSSCPKCKTRVVIPGVKLDCPEQLPVAVPAPPAPAPVVVLPVIGETRVPCPYCGEAIVASARKCRFCNEILDPDLRREKKEIEPKQPQHVINVITNQHATAQSEAQASPIIKNRAESRARSDARATATAKSGSRFWGCSCLSVLLVLLGCLGCVGLGALMPPPQQTPRKAKDAKDMKDAKDVKVDKDLKDAKGIADKPGGDPVGNGQAK